MFVGLVIVMLLKLRRIRFLFKLQLIQGNDKLDKVSSNLLNSLAHYFLYHTLYFPGQVISKYILTNKLLFNNNTFSDFALLARIS